MSAISRMHKIVKSPHWLELNWEHQYAWEVSYFFIHTPIYHDRSFKKRKYYRRKKYFTPYESHRKKGVEYLPF